jgi:hypothetical protein
MSKKACPLDLRAADWSAQGMTDPKRKGDVFAEAVVIAKHQTLPPPSVQGAFARSCTPTGHQVPCGSPEGSPKGFGIEATALTPRCCFPRPPQLYAQTLQQLEVIRTSRDLQERQRAFKEQQPSRFEGLSTATSTRDSSCSDHVLSSSLRETAGASKTADQRSRHAVHRHPPPTIRVRSLTVSGVKGSFRALLDANAQLRVHARRPAAKACTAIFICWLKGVLPNVAFRLEGRASHPSRALVHVDSVPSRSTSSEAARCPRPTEG